MAFFQRNQTMTEQRLLGDRVEAAMKTIGADKVAKLYSKLGRKPCGCAGRKAALNKWHMNALDFINKDKSSGS